MSKPISDICLYSYSTIATYALRHKFLLERLREVNVREYYILTAAIFWETTDNQFFTRLDTSPPHANISIS